MQKCYKKGIDIIGRYLYNKDKKRRYTEVERRYKMTSIREWSSVEWANHYTDQEELKRMVKAILENADDIENKPTPGCSEQNLSRVIIAKSSIITGTKYVIHTYGFRVTDITEIVQH